MGNTVVVAALVALGLAVLAVVFYSLGRKKRAGRPDTVLEAAWDHYVGHAARRSTRHHRAVEDLGRLDEGAVARLRTAVGKAVDDALATANARSALRQATMEATDRFVLAETLEGARSGAGDTAGDRPTDADDYLEAVVEAGVLRSASLLRFEDFSADDWYAHYLSVAEMNSKHVATMIRQTVEGEESSLETSLHEPLSRAMRQVRETLLQHPPRTPVRRSDKLADGEFQVRLTPRQSQIDALTGLMSMRFEKLFSGQVYRSERASEPVDRAGAFQLDAGLLYTLLAVNFRHPTDAWRQIMNEALGSYRGAMQSEENLLDTAKEFQRVWEDGSQDGPLNAVLNTASGTVLQASESSDPKALVSGMMEDAAVLVGNIRNVIDER